MIDVDAFRAEAEAWLAANRKDAPRDYGAILPPDLREDGTAWQRRLFDAGFAGIHWPVEHGGPGWNQKTTGPDSLTTPPQSKNYGGFNEELFVVYDLSPRIAIAWENDAHQGAFTPKKISGQPDTEDDLS